MTSMNPLRADPWPQTTVDGRARVTALAAHAAPVDAIVPAASVTYRSAGRVLVIGDGAAAVAALPDLATLRCVVLCTDADSCPTEEMQSPPIAWLAGSVVSLEGHLGAFHVVAATAAGEQRDPAAALGGEQAVFDLILDLQPQPSLVREKLPPGYFATHGNTQAAGEALAQLPDLVGEFDKPRYFAYEADICAHARRGLNGCRNCLDACAAEAIRSIGESIEVDPYLCQGCGSCATVCPTGAMTYAFPPVDEWLTVVRRTLHAYYEAGGTHACILLHDDGAGADRVAALRARLPEQVLTFALEDVGELGIEAWLAMLAYGADHVVMAAAADTPARELAATARQIDFLRPILSGLGGAPEQVRLLEHHEDLVACLEGLVPQPSRSAATFAAVGGKRAVFHLALEDLHRYAGGHADTVALPPDAPFGAIRVDRDACTLCMACVSVCPSMAVVGGGDQPRLLFREDRCVQCGLCETACPEDAISLTPQLNYAAHVAPAEVVLNEEEMFHCVGCGKPFATRKMMDRMAQKLAGHWMFQDERSRRRIRMCEDCRVKDIFADEASPRVHK